MKKLTKQQAVIISGFTGIMHGKFSDLHEDVERRAGRPVFTHEFAESSWIKDLYRDDFMAIQPEEE